jgi:hypothetical protein
MLTNASGPLYQNFSGDTVQGALKNAPQFLLNNPVARQRKYLMENPNVAEGSPDSRDAVKDDEKHAMEMLVELFNWLDSLEPQPTTEKLVPPPHISAWIDQVTPKKAQNSAQNSALFALLAGGTSVLSAVGGGCGVEARSQPPSGTELVNLLRRVRQIFVGE